MDRLKFFCAGQTKALQYAAAELQRYGCDLQSSSGDFLLTDVPLREDPANIIRICPAETTIIGGNLYSNVFDGYKTADLLTDPIYLAENAKITAHCAVKLLLNQLPVILSGLPVLVIGWGRIGKCLAALLRQLGAQVSVTVRKETDAALLGALDYKAARLDDLQEYRVIVNTVPAMVLPTEHLEACSPDCLKMDLASVRGLAGDDVLWARGLPGKDAPESSGKLIARRALHYMKGVLA